MFVFTTVHPVSNSNAYDTVCIKISDIDSDICSGGGCDTNLQMQINSCTVYSKNSSLVDPCPIPIPGL